MGLIYFVVSESKETLFGESLFWRLSSVFCLQSWTRNRTRVRALILSSRISLFPAHGHDCISHLLCDPWRSCKPWSHVTLMGSSSWHPAGLNSLSGLGERCQPPLLFRFPQTMQESRSLVCIRFSPSPPSPQVSVLRGACLGFVLQEPQQHKWDKVHRRTEPSAAWLIFFVDFLLLRTGIHYSASKQE